MLYVQFDAQATAASERRPPAGLRAVLRVRRLAPVLDGLEMRASEPAVLVFRYAVAFTLGVEALSLATWRERGLDIGRGFALVLGERAADGRWPIGIAGFAVAPERLRGWLQSRGVRATIDGDLALAGLSDAAIAARAPWEGDPYLEVVARFEHGGLWCAAMRRGDRYQVEMVSSLPGLPPLHVIARDPPSGISEVIPPGSEPPLRLRRSATEPLLPGPFEPPTWDEPGPCDCGVPPDLCAMKRFDLSGADGTSRSALRGADIFRQLSASLIDLHAVRSSELPSLVARDRVVVARSPESIASLGAEDAVLDHDGIARRRGRSTPNELAGAILSPLPWPPLEQSGAFRKTFSGIW